MIDQKITASNGIVAAIELKGKVKADKFVEGEWKQCSSTSAFVCSLPYGSIDKQVLYGERFRVLEERSGWSFGQCGGDLYTGYIESKYLGDCCENTHFVKSVFTNEYYEPNIKTIPTRWYSFGSRLQIVSHGEEFCELANGSFVPSKHLYDETSRPTDFLSMARIFLGMPYLWAGNGASGIDCSGLVQMATNAVGYNCPRDSYMQRNWMKKIPHNKVKLGDFAFWNGHVGIIDENEHLLHATAHSMQVVSEPLKIAKNRIEKLLHVKFLGYARLPKKESIYLKIRKR